jgi:hypothetical protein
MFKKGKRIMMQPKWLSQWWNPGIILGIAAFHYVATGISVAVGFGLAMSRFDSGTSLSLGEKVLSTLGEILLFPLASALPSGVPEPIQFAIVVLNSLLWGSLLYLLAKSLSDFLSKLLK